MADYIAGEQTTLSMGDGTAQTVIANVVSVEFSGFVREPVTITALGDSQKKTRPSTQFDGGTCTLVVNYDPQDTQHKALHDNVAADGTSWTASDESFTVNYPDGSKHEFDGWINSFQPQGIASEDSNLQASVTINITDGPTFTGGV